MGIKQITTETPGQIGVNPRYVRIITTDNLATVTTAGYLNPVSLEGFFILPTDIIDMWYGYVSNTNTGTLGRFTPNISNGVITLNAWENPGNVLLPVVSGNFAVFNGTTGQIEDAGYLPSDATLTNVVMQDAASIVGNLPQYSDVDGTIEDSGIAAADVQLNTNIIAGRTADIGGGGAGPISVVVAGLTAASIVNANINASTNTVSVAKVTATATGFDILFDADPGAACVVDYQAFIAAQ